MEIPGYTIEKQIGRGGMARVYLALHHGLYRQVAIKVMNRQMDDDEMNFSERFMREARIVANLTHQNIVTIYDVGKHDGYHYISMEYLSDGNTLDHKIKDGLSLQDGLTTVKQIAASLGYAHGKGIVHRDVKPDNIMYREDGTAVLTDFGIARAAAPSTKMTATGTVIGTPHYMSPEQGQGQEVGAFSDIYSLGVVFYEILTGKVPYVADSSIAVLFKHISEPVPALQDELAIYQPIIDCMLAKKPEERYKTCEQVIHDIDSTSRGGQADNAAMINDATVIRKVVPTAGISAKGATVRISEKTWGDLQQDKPKSNNKIIMAAVVAIAVIAVSVGGYLYTQQIAEEDKLAQQKKLQLDKRAALVEKQRLDAQQAKEKAKQEKEKRLAIRKKKEQDYNLAVQKAREQKEKQKAAEEALTRKARQEKQRKINALLVTAEQQLLNTQLSKAYQTYKTVLKLDSLNKSANNGVTRVANSYLSLANTAAVR